jgi:hypothetical protein
MKWMRKNNTKLMAVVVIVLMVAFIGGASFQYLFRGSGGAKKTIAYYGRNQKITRYDRYVAERELKVLEDLRAADLLRSQDLRGLLLSELLFPQSRDSAAVLDMARQTIQRNQYRISDKQLSDLYRNRTVPSDFYWLLLREEAESAGIHVANEEVGDLLSKIVPQLFEGRTYAQMMHVWMREYGVPEDQILSVFGRLLAVLQYTQVISSAQNLTASQIRHIASREGETLSAEFVQLEASAFADKEHSPAEDAMLQHFNRYKAVVPGDVNEANPFGFGYRLPNRVQIEYIALKLPDVAAVVKPPTNEDAEQYYRQNRAREFTEKVPVDPNDSNSPLVDRTKSYVEAVDDILTRLRRQRILTRAEQILQEARNLADAGMQIAGADGNEPTTEERKERAAHKDRDYGRIAQDLSVKHSLPLYSGRTGHLSAIDVRNDRYLRRMFLMNYGSSGIPLSQVLFSVEEFGDDATVLLAAPAAQMFMSIGPARDPISATAPDLTNQIMLIARVVAAEPDAAPEGPEVSYSIRSLDLGDTTEPQDKTFQVKDQVVKDLGILAAWEATRAKAEEFLALATQDGWDRAVAQFNQLYGEQAKTSPTDPNVFRLDHRMSVQRISSADLQGLAAQIGSNPASAIYLNEARVESEFVERLYSLAPADPNAAPQKPQLMEFKPGRSFYAIKSLTPQAITLEQFQRMKGMVMGREEYGQAQSLAAVHLNPDNVLKRMNFRFAEDAK